jgi:hypothetical protein
MSSPRPDDFLAAFSQENEYCLSLPILWTVSIDGVTDSNINQILQNAGEKWRSNITPNDMTKNGSILPAQSVSIPNENSNFDAGNVGDGSVGSFLPGYVLTSRENFLSRSFSINFLETRRDLEHEFFRPWSIALSIKGLIETAPRLKADIVVKQYTNQGELRKGYIFKKAFPTAIEGFSLDYNNTDFIIKSVTFGCQNYEQIYNNTSTR